MCDAKRAWLSAETWIWESEEVSASLGQTGRQLTPGDPFGTPLGSARRILQLMMEYLGAPDPEEFLGVAIWMAARVWGLGSGNIVVSLPILCTP